jgi:hypothetical protein
MAEYREIRFAIENAFRRLEKETVTPWAFLRSKMPEVKDFDGRLIRYEGVEFEGSPRQRFWSGFIEPFLEDIVAKGFQMALEHAKQRGFAATECITVARQALRSGVVDIYHRMQNIDRRLRGKGFPSSVSPKDITDEIGAMHSKIDGYYASAEKSVRAALVEKQPEILAYGVEHYPDPSKTNQRSGVTMNPTAFISYSWDDTNHKKWVKLFATKLRENGIESILDQWHTVPGDQLPQFMETAIRENDFVLIVCTPTYKSKSDSRAGGVGYEGDIITGEVFASRNKRKFIPILARGTWEESAPTWIKGKRYVDLRAGILNDDNFAELTTTILGKNEEAPPVAVAPTQPKHQAAAVTSGSPDKHVTKVMEDILRLFREAKADAGHALNMRGFMHRYVINYNPKEKAAIGTALAELEKQGIVELKSGQPFLTEAGVGCIY